MRPPRFRIRMLMIAVAAVAFALGMRSLKERRDERLARRDSYFIRVRRHRIIKQDSENFGRPLHPYWQHRLDYFEAMERKWERAARYPWLSIPPDPPPPE